MTCPCPSYLHAQGKGECSCSRDASRDAMKSPTVFLIAAVLAVAALWLVMDKLGIPMVLL